MPSSFDCDTVPKLIPAVSLERTHQERKEMDLGLLIAMPLTSTFCDVFFFVWSILTMESLSEGWRATNVLFTTLHHVSTALWFPGSPEAEKASEENSP